MFESSASKQEQVQEVIVMFWTRVCFSTADVRSLFYVACC